MIPPRCAWCDGPIPPGKRRDAVTCSQPCRQARHRFGAGASAVVEATRRLEAVDPRRLAYADPPYPGKAALYYLDHPDYAGEVDHAELVEYLEATFPHGWALSTSAEALPLILEVCPRRRPDDPRAVKVAAWTRGPRHVAAWEPVNAWEPVIYRLGPRRYKADPGERVDALVAGVSARTTDPRRVVGAKPAEFCYWLFALLGAVPGDELVDVFPGSGGIGRAWAEVNRLAVVDASAAALGDGSPRARRDASPLELPASSSSAP